MVLEDRLFPVPLLAGLQTKNDPKQLNPNELIELENATFGVPGRLTKRYGFDSMPNKLVSSQIQQGKALATYNDELLLFTGTQSCSYSPAIEQWVPKGQAVSIITKKEQLLSNTDQQFLVTSVLLGDYEIYAYTDLNTATGFTGVRYTIIDHNTKVRLIDNKVVDNAGIMPQIAVYNSIAYIFYITSNASSTNLVYKVFNPALPFNLSTAVILFTDLNAAHANYDVIVSKGATQKLIRIFYNQASGDGYGNSIYFAYDDLTVSPVVEGTSTNSNNGVALTTDLAGNTWLIFADEAKIKAKAYNDDGYEAGAEKVIQQMTNVNRITAHPTEDGIKIYFEIKANDSANYYINSADLSLTKPSVGHFSDEIDNLTDVLPETVIGNSGIGTYSIVVTLTVTQSNYTSDTMDAQVWINGSPETILSAVPISNPPQVYVSNPLVINFDAVIPVQLSTTADSPPLNLNYNIAIDATQINVGGVIKTSNLGIFKRSVGLYSKPFLVGETYYLAVQHVSPLQSSYFVLDQNKNIISRMMYGEGATIVDGYFKCLCQPSQDDSGTFFPVINLGFNNTLVGLSRINLDFVNNNSFIGVTAAGTYNMVGGIVQCYDNTFFVENNFLLYPEGTVATPIDGTQSMGIGSYLYKIIYASTNNLRNPEYSTTSVILTAQLDAPGNIQLTLPTLRLTQKPQVLIQIYRTEAGQSINYYKVGEVLSNPLVDTLSFTDTMNDETLISQLPIYTTGDVLDNFSPSSCNLMAICNNRCFISGLETANSINYSKIIAPGFALEFAEEFQILCDPAGGDITALGEIDGKLIIFKESAIFYLQGNGPDNFGQSNDFGPPQLISTDVGCISANSLVKTDQGLMFQSSKGIYLLDRSNQVNPYIGSPVAAYNNLMVTSAKLMEKFNEVRFTTSQNILVYNYYVNEWSVTTNLGDVVDSELWQNQYVVLNSSGIVKKENLTSKTDDGQFVSMKFTTSWLNPSGVIQGFQKVWRVAFVGNYYTPHNLNLEFAYNYEPFTTGNLSIDARTIVSDPPAYNQGLYNQGTYGGVWYPYQARLVLARQRCEAIKITIYDSPIEGQDPGEGYDISALTLELGVEKGITKLRDGASFGSSG